jgi:excisionase family DNA binding protein
MKLTLGQAAKHVGCSKPTLSRAIKAGRLSAERREDGSYSIDPAELQRYAEAAEHRLGRSGNDNLYETGTLTRSTTPSVASVLQAQLDGLRSELEQVISERDDLRRRLDMEGEERRKLTALLTHQREKPPQKPVEGLLSRAWSILRGKS